MQSLKQTDKDPLTTVDVSLTREDVLIDLDLGFNQDIGSVMFKLDGNRFIGVELSLEVSSDGNNYHAVKEFVSRSRGILGWRTNFY